MARIKLLSESMLGRKVRFIHWTRTGDSSDSATIEGEVVAVYMFEASIWLGVIDDTGVTYERAFQNVTVLSE